MTKNKNRSNLQYFAQAWSAWAFFAFKLNLQFCILMLLQEVYPNFGLLADHHFQAYFAVHYLLSTLYKFV
ncbi:hypothetical protein FNJ57_07380 [Lactococcus lactis]|nr:hypothetical protein FNJ56_07105 [Lactococcus lactis]TRW67747.1 hypothetical protein FNJ57_07380 [Lactococcus lactis]